MGDIIQDYDYYEANAKDVKLEDITSDADNADILARLRDDDPYVTYFSIVTEVEDSYDFVVREGDDLGWLGYFVGRSQKLESLFIDNFPEHVNINSFFKGLGRNRSIQDLFIGKDLGESFQSLIPFLRDNDRLTHLCFTSFGVGLQCARSITLLLSQQSSWKRISFDETVFDHEGLKQIAIALRSQSQMEELRMNGNSVGRNGYAALGNALEGCLSLKKLDLAEYDNNVDDERLVDDKGINALLEGLKYCHNLTSLNLYGNLMITEEGLRSLSTLFQSDNCRLEHLELSEMNIDDDGAAALATGLASLPSLRRLNLCGMSISDRGLQDLVRGLVNCNLEVLDLSRIHSVGDQGLRDLVRGLVNCNIEKLVLSNNMLGSISGMRSLGTFVRGTTSMRSLFLGNCFVTDEGLQSFVEGMANCCNLKELNLSYNRSITASGLASVASLLRTECCSLCTLDLFGINIGDDGAAALANGLIGNKSLTNLKFDVSSSGVTARGWGAFSKLLCNTSNVNNTYRSNHTLEHIGIGYGTPSDILEVLKWNQSLERSAAICKILRSHPDIDVTPLFQWEMKCLPLVVAWLEKAKPYLDNVNESTESFQRRQLSTVYMFVRGMPLLAANGFRSETMKDIQLQSKKKRKFD